MGVKMFTRTAAFRTVYIEEKRSHQMIPRRPKGIKILGGPERMVHKNKSAGLISSNECHMFFSVNNFLEHI